MLCPSSIQRRDLDPQPSEHESPPITTRPEVRNFTLLLTQTASKLRTIAAR